MEVSITYSRALSGINSPLVIVEVHLSRGLPGLSIVGMPETAVKESKDRVRSAILNNHFEYPLRRITINLAPAVLPKDSGPDLSEIKAQHHAKRALEIAASGQHNLLRL